MAPAFSLSCARGIRNSGSLAVFLLALAVYLLTLEHGASYWDCPEYVVTATMMEVGHPPGNPFWSLAMRFVTIFVPASKAAIAINACSALFTALAMMLLFRICFFLISLYYGERFSLAKARLAGVASLEASLCLAWSDSVWFSAVEAEVYALSLLLTMLTVWLMLRWTQVSSPGRRSQYLILIAYIMGLSIGVHQLNLLTIPALGLIYVYTRHPHRGAMRRVIASLLISFIAIAIILAGIMPLSIRLAGLTELFAVNSLGMPYFSGVVAFCGILLILFIVAAIAARKWGRRRLYTALWMTGMLLLGFSTFSVILIRGAASPPMNESAPSDIFALEAYIGRDQYGSKPIFYGPTPFSPPLRIEMMKADSTADYSRFALQKGKARMVPYMEGNKLTSQSGLKTREDSAANQGVADARHGYLLADYAYTYIHAPETDMLLPRITSSNPSHMSAYSAWAGMPTNNMREVEASYAIDADGHPVGKLEANGSRTKSKVKVPTYWQNFQYLLSYQLGYMYFRYLLWNFVGRQNDINAAGEVDHGNFITGITPLDNLMLGANDKLPAEIGTDNRGRNAYYLLPLLLAIIGVAALCLRGRLGRRICFANFIFFLLTGVAIAFYVNQTPNEPRERDYSFLGSYMAVGVWIAFGIIEVSELAYKKAGPQLKKRSRRNSWAMAVAFLCLGVPVVMLAENFDDHDRTGRSAVEDYASNILLSLPHNAIFIVDGDNLTFPLWYAQETLGVRPDVTVVNASYLTLPSYRLTLMQPTAGTQGVKSLAAPGQLAYGAFSFSRVAGNASDLEVPLPEALTALFNDTTPAPRFLHDKVWLLDAEGDTIHLSLRKIISESGKSWLPFSNLMMLDIVAANTIGTTPRPVVVNATVKHALYKPLQGALRPTLFGKTYLPGASDSALLAADFQAIAHMRSGGFERRSERANPYLDPATALQLRQQRAALLRLSRRLLDAGQPTQALSTLLAADSLFSFKLAPFTYTVNGDSIFYEGMEYVELMRKAAAITGSAKAQALADSASANIERRKGEYKRYYNLLPQRLRHAVSYESRIMMQHPDTHRK